MEIKLSRIHNGTGGIFASIISHLDFDNHADSIKDLIIDLTNVQPSTITCYDWAPSAGMGYFEYSPDNYKSSILMRYYFDLYRLSTEIKLTILDSPTNSFIGRSGRLKMIECLTKKDRYKNIDRICNITGMSQHLVMSDIETITKWDELRRDVIKLVVDRGFDVSTEIEGILGLADTDILKIMQQLRRAGEIPPSRFYHKSKK